MRQHTSRLAMHILNSLVITPQPRCVENAVQRQQSNHGRYSPGSLRDYPKWRNVSGRRSRLLGPNMDHKEAVHGSIARISMGSHLLSLTTRTSTDPERSQGY